MLTPEPDANAEVSSESLYVLVAEGVIPASDRKVKVGRVWQYHVRKPGSE